MVHFNRPVRPLKSWLTLFFFSWRFSQKLEKQNWQNENSKYFFQTNGVNSLRLINLGLGWVFYLLPPVLFFCLSSVITLYTTVAQTQSDKYKKKFQWTNLSLMFLKTRTVWCASSHITKGKTNRFTTPCFWILRFFSPVLAELVRIFDNNWPNLTTQFEKKNSFLFSFFIIKKKTVLNG